MEAGSIASEARPAVSAWRSIAATFAITLAVAALYWPTLRSLVQLWMDFDGLTYTHGSLIAVMSAWLIVRARPIMPVATSGRATVVAALAGASLLWLLSYRAGIEIFAQLLFPCIAWLSVFALLGQGVARRCAFAFAYLYFAIPIWDFGNGLLQSLTLSAVSVALTIAGIPAFVEGSLVHIPSGVFEIAGGCSGLHFFIVATAIAALYGELSEDTLTARAQLLVLAAMLAVLCNWTRVFWIIRAGYETGMQHPLVSVSHYYFGWKVFAAMMVVFFLIARLLPVSAGAGNVVAAPAASARRFVQWMPLVLAAALLGPAWALMTAGGAARDAGAFALPAAIAGWGARLGGQAQWHPTFIGADFTDTATYGTGPVSVAAFTAIYLEQQQGKELIGFGNAIHGALEPVAFARVTRPAGEFGEIQTRDSAGNVSLIWYYYDIEGWRTTRGPLAQLMYGLRSLAGAPLSRVVALRALCMEDCATARANLERLSARLDSVLPALR